MTLSMFDVMVPPLKRALAATMVVIDKAEQFSKDSGVPERALVGAQLYDDMYSFARQVEQLTLHAVTGAAKLSGRDAPELGEIPQSFEDMRNRVAAAKTFIEALSPDALADTETKFIQLVFPAMTMEFVGLTYLTEFVLPSVFFHVVTGYDIMRHRGVPLGKLDFLGAYPSVPEAIRSGA